MAQDSFQNDKILIETPQGKVIQRSYTKGKNKGSAYVRIVWNTGFGPAMTNTLKNTQTFIDSEVMRLMEPYMPLDTGMMIKSMMVTTVIGSGRVEVNTPYAMAVLRGKSSVGRPTGPLRGPQYFERFKADKLPTLRASVAKLTGGKVK
jgi:hypothetical protein